MSLMPTPADQRLRLGGNVFLVSLSVFFLAGMILFFLIATWRRDQFAEVKLPWGFVESSFLLIGTSGALIYALVSVRRNRHPALMISLAVAMVSSLIFILVQSFAMENLIVNGIERSGTRGLWGMVVTLAVLHALHVAGGVIGLSLVIYQAARYRYDHESHWPVQFIGNYWHFLDLVWLSMLLSFWMSSSGFNR